MCFSAHSIELGIHDVVPSLMWGVYCFEIPDLFSKNHAHLLCFLRTTVDDNDRMNVSRSGCLLFCSNGLPSVVPANELVGTYMHTYH